MGERCLHTVVPWLVELVGYIIGVSTMVTGARYIAMVSTYRARSTTVLLKNKIEPPQVPSGSGLRRYALNSRVYALA